MNLFFHQTYHYTLTSSIEEAHARLKFLVSRRFEDYSVDLVGNLYQDGRFFLGNKWPIPGMTKFERKAASIKGALEKKNDLTLIRLSIRPHIAYIVLFYFFLLLTAIEIFSPEDVVPIDYQYKLAVLVAIDLTLLAFLFVFPYRIRQRFERLTDFSIE